MDRRKLFQAGIVAGCFGAGALINLPLAAAAQETCPVLNPEAVKQALGGLKGSVAKLQSVQTELQQQEQELKNQLGSQMSSNLQMIMDQRSKLLQTASDIEKTIADDANAMAQNIKE